MYLQALSRRLVKACVRRAGSPLALHRRPEVDADRAHVTNDLRRGFLEGDVEGAFTPIRGGAHEVGGDAALAAPGGAGDQDGAAAVVPAPLEHRVELGHARADALGADLVLQRERGDGQHADSVLVDQERILVGPLRRAAVLDHAQTARRDLLDDPVIQEDDAVGDVFLETVPGQRPVAALPGDHRRDPLVLQPAEQAAQLGAQDPISLRSTRT
jgi:hypothetical protein